MKPLRATFEEIFENCTADDLKQGDRKIIDSLLTAVEEQNEYVIGKDLKIERGHRDEVLHLTTNDVFESINEEKKLQKQRSKESTK